MRFDETIDQLLESISVPPKAGRKMHVTPKSDSQGMTSGDIDAATFNSVKTLKGDLLPSAKEVLSKKKAKKRITR